VQDAAATLRADPAAASAFGNVADAALGARGQIQGVITDLAGVNEELRKFDGRTFTFTVDGKYTAGAQAAASFLSGRVAV
jgi:hypothetical protein